MARFIVLMAAAPVAAGDLTGVSWRMVIGLLKACLAQGGEGIP